MQFWTTFTPQKVSWELTTIASKGKKPDSHWQQHLPLIRKSLKLLYASGIVGIRLVILPDELTRDGKTFDWKAIDTMLALCQKSHLAVDLCLGPLQYPNYPGIYLPENLLQYVSAGATQLDSLKPITDYALSFLQEQLTRYGQDKRIRGFHFANEWPDRQGIKGKESLKGEVSEEFMLQLARMIVSQTTKPIALNTNIDAADKGRLRRVFTNLLGVLGTQVKLGFDIYPSQESWQKTFFQKLRRLFEPYPVSFAWSRRHFSQCAIYFCEVEAQPWGSGQSWYQMIRCAPNPQQNILLYTNKTMEETVRTYLQPCAPQEVSLWGADFWLCAQAMQVDWPLTNVKKFARKRG